MGMPSKNKIVEYWQAEHEAGRPSPWLPDWGWDKPECMACGYLSDYWKDWTTSSLDRCHIIPKALGGEDEASNLVLMCRRCHQDSPDCSDPQILIRWMEERPKLVLGQHSVEFLIKMENLVSELVREHPDVTHEMFGIAYKQALEQFSDHFAIGFSEASRWEATRIAVDALRNELSGVE